MLKYLMLRVFLLFTIKFFLSWGSNINNQFYHFFGISLTYEWYLQILSVLIMAIIFAIGIAVLNFIPLFFWMTDKYTFTQIIVKIKSIGFLNSFKMFFTNFISFLNSNFYYIINNERYPNLIVFILIVFVSLSKFNPLLNNYYGLYKEYETEGIDINYNASTTYDEKNFYIIEKEDLKKTVSSMKYRPDNIEEDEEDIYYEVKKRGYIFFQSALIDGFTSSKNRFVGFGSYVECLIFNAIEKFINVILYFMFPFLICFLLNLYISAKKNIENK